MSKATFVSSKWLGIASSNGVFLISRLADFINVIVFLPTKYFNMLKYAHAKFALRKQVKTSGLNHEKFVQFMCINGGKY